MPPLIASPNLICQIIQIPSLYNVWYGHEQYIIIVNTICLKSLETLNWPRTIRCDGNYYNLSNRWINPYNNIEILRAIITRCH